MKFVCCMIGDKCADSLKLSVDNIINDVDKLFFVWGTEDNITLTALENLQTEYPEKIVILKRRYEHEHKGANGRARNAYLEMIKEWKTTKGITEDIWTLVLDPDEVLENFTALKELIKTKQNQDCKFFNLKMEHFIGNLHNFDNIKQEHYTALRFFKYTNEIKYPEWEHTMPIISLGERIMNINFITIWHFGYCRDMFRVLHRYETNLKKSNIHDIKFLRHWYISHLFGRYPKRQLSPVHLPKSIRKKFLIEDIGEELYFMERMQLPGVMFLEAKEWIDYFDLKSQNKQGEKKEVLCIGCGVGHRVKVFETFGVESSGFDISNWAIKNTPYNNIAVWTDDILQLTVGTEQGYDLVTAYDILEHLEEKDLDKALQNIKSLSKRYILFSIPFEGDPNLHNDPTHKIFRPKQWWIEQFEKNGIKITGPPKEWTNAHQLLIGEVKE